MKTEHNDMFNLFYNKYSYIRFTSHFFNSFCINGIRYVLYYTLKNRVNA